MKGKPSNIGRHTVGEITLTFMNTRNLSVEGSDIYDSIIIGGGPAGLAVANSFQKQSIRYLVVEQNHIAYNVSRFPVTMTFFSGRKLLEIDDFDLTIPEDKPTREQYLTYLFHFMKRRRLKIRDYTRVLSVKRNKSIFHLEIQNSGGAIEYLQSRSVVVACGALDNPVMLNVEGENLPHVSHYFTEVYPFVGHQVLIVGSGNSAVETALKLYRAGCSVSFSCRERDLSPTKIKYWLYPDIVKRFEKKEIAYYPETAVSRIENHRTLLEARSGGQHEVPADFVLALTGYIPPLEFLKKMNIEIHNDTVVPVHSNVTLETNVEGIFLAGAITGGNISGKVFIENSRDHGEMILPRLKELLQ